MCISDNNSVGVADQGHCECHWCSLGKQPSRILSSVPLILEEMCDTDLVLNSHV